MNIQTLNIEQSHEYRNGWKVNGEWHCPKCGTMIGKNLLGERPYLLAMQHIVKCYPEKK